MRSQFVKRYTVQTTTTMDHDVNNDCTIDPESESGWYWLTDVADGDYIVREVVQDGWRQTAPYDGLALQAWELDRDLDLQITGNLFEDWGGLDEKWMLGSQDWHYITPDGDLFAWDGASQFPLIGTLVDSLNSEYYVDPSLLYDAV